MKKFNFLINKKILRIFIGIFLVLESMHVMMLISNLLSNDPKSFSTFYENGIVPLIMYPIYYFICCYFAKFLPQRSKQ